jgi:hypothetical protein
MYQRDVPEFGSIQRICGEQTYERLMADIIRFASEENTAAP